MQEGGALAVYTDIAKVTVQDFNETMHDLQGNQFVICRADTANKEQRRVSSVDHLCIFLRGQLSYYN